MQQNHTFFIKLNIQRRKSHSLKNGGGKIKIGGFEYSESLRLNSLTNFSVLG
nr:MAG TPA: hypothetical protein [Caudoviricetes sp.]